MVGLLFDQRTMNGSAIATPRDDRRSDRALPPRGGTSFKLEHFAAILERGPDVGWFEVHAENYMVAGGPRLDALERLRERYSLSLHGVALSLGGAERPDRNHLAALRRLADRFQPLQVSEHIAWSVHDGVYFADLLPVPLSREALDRLCDNIDETQNHLGRTILIENPSNYLSLPGAEMTEPEFLTAAARRTGCGLLIDVNNIHVSAANIGLDPLAYLDALPADAIGEIHVAGHSLDRAGADGLLIDDHGSAVADEVWDLCRHLLTRVGPRPVLVEWDNNLPDWPRLEAEAHKAEACIREAARQTAVAVQ